MATTSTPAVSTQAAPTQTAEVQLAVPPDGNIDFVVSDMKWALGSRCRQEWRVPQRPDDDAERCLSGDTPKGVAAKGRTTRTISPNSGGDGAGTECPKCLRVSREAPDRTRSYRTVSGPNIRTYGIDLDGQDSRSKGRPAAGTCAHDDFQGMNGERGIDNQFYRAVGCSKGFQSGGGKLVFATEMLTGSWGILITLKGVDSLVNDNDVEVGMFANARADPAQCRPHPACLCNLCDRSETQIPGPDPWPDREWSADHRSGECAFPLDRQQYAPGTPDRWRAAAHDTA